MNHLDSQLFAFAISKVIAYKERGRLYDDEASAWMAEACRLVGCSDIVNVRGGELRRDYHAGPRDVAWEAHF